MPSAPSTTAPATGAGAPAVLHLFGHPISFRRGVVLAVIAATLLRVRFLLEPLVADEGGALSAARNWAAGGRLYDTVWVDRPQGVLLLFRGWDALPGTGPSSARMLAVLLGAATIVAVAHLARMVRSPRAGVLAAWCAALATAAPIIEGFTANGEVLTTGLAVPGLTVAATVLLGRRPTWWLLLAGLLCGAALTVKQSAFDGILAIGAWLLLAVVLHWLPFRRALLQAVVFATGVAAVLAASAVHGAAIGWDRYWYAVAGFRLGARSAVTNTEWDKLGLSLLFAIPALAPLVVVAVRSTRGVQWRATLRSQGHLLIGLWCLFAFFAFATGGSFHRHYFLLLAAPLATAAGLAADRAPAAARRPLLAAGVVAALAAAPFVAVPSLILGNAPSTNREIAGWLHRVEDAEGPTTIYAYCASAAIYSEIGIDPPYPYLWADHVRMTDDGQQRLRDYLSGPDAPDFVARFQTDDSLCDVDGSIVAVLAERYVHEGDIGEAEILRREDREAPSVAP